MSPRTPVEVLALKANLNFAKATFLELLFFANRLNKSFSEPLWAQMEEIPDFSLDEDDEASNVHWSLLSKFVKHIVDMIM